MKKLLLVWVAITFIFASCSKERKLNKRLDGEWSLETVYGTALTSKESGTIEFNKDKKDNGTYRMTYTDTSYVQTETGTYTLDKDEKILFVPSSNSLSTNFINTVSDYDKCSLTMVDPDGWL